MSPSLLRAPMRVHAAAVCALVCMLAMLWSAAPVRGECVRTSPHILDFCGDRVNYTWWLHPERSKYMTPSLQDLVARNLYDMHKDDLEVRLSKLDPRFQLGEAERAHNKDVRKEFYQFRDRMYTNDIELMERHVVHGAVHPHLRMPQLRDVDVRGLGERIDDVHLELLALTAAPNEQPPWKRRAGKEKSKRAKDPLNAVKEGERKERNDKLAESLEAAEGAEESAKVAPLAAKVKKISAQTHARAAKLPDPDKVGNIPQAQALQACKDAADACDVVAKAVAKIKDIGKEFMGKSVEEKEKFEKRVLTVVEGGAALCESVQRVLKDKNVHARGLEKMELGKEMGRQAESEGKRMAQAAEFVAGHYPLGRAVHVATWQAKYVADACKILAAASRDLAAAGAKAEGRIGSAHVQDLTLSYENAYQYAVRAQRAALKVGVEQASQVVVNAEKVIDGSTDVETALDKCSNADLDKIATRARELAQEAKAAAVASERLLKVGMDDHEGVEVDEARRAIEPADAERVRIAKKKKADAEALAKEKAQCVKREKDKQAAEEADKAGKNEPKPKRKESWKQPSVDNPNGKRKGPHYFRDKANAAKPMDPQDCLEAYKDFVCAWQFKRCDNEFQPMAVCRRTCETYAAKCRISVDCDDDKFYAQRPMCSSGIIWDRENFPPNMSP